MPVFHTVKRVMVPAAVAFNVAADVASYEHFLPLMTRSAIKGTKQQMPHGERFDAELAVSYPKLGLAEAFVSTVNTNNKNLTVTATSTDGPFRRVETIWSIAPAGSGADVSIRIDYAFRNPLLQLAAAGLMDMAIGKVMSAFEVRARQIMTEHDAREQGQGRINA